MVENLVGSSITTAEQEQQGEIERLKAENERLLAENERLRMELAKRDSLIYKLRNSFELAKQLTVDMYEQFVALRMEMLPRIHAASDLCQMICQSPNLYLGNTARRVREMLASTNWGYNLHALQDTDFMYPTEEMARYA